MRLLVLAAKVSGISVLWVSNGARDRAKYELHRPSVTPSLSNGHNVGRAVAYCRMEKRGSDSDPPKSLTSDGQLKFSMGLYGRRGMRQNRINKYNRFDNSGLCKGCVYPSNEGSSKYQLELLLRVGNQNYNWPLCLGI